MNVQVYESIGRQIEDLKMQQAHAAAQIIRGSPCHRCPFVTSPGAGVIPTCKDVRAGNYARRITAIDACARWKREVRP